MKKIIYMLLITFLIVCNSAYAEKDIITYTQETDIICTINDVEVESYYIDGFLYLPLDSLESIGFKIQYDKHINISLKISSLKLENSIIPEMTEKIPVSESDKVVYINGNETNAYSINDRIVIQADELQVFGDVVWNSEDKKLSVSISALEIDDRWGIVQKSDFNENQKNKVGDYYFLLDQTDSDGNTVMCYSTDGINYEKLPGVDISWKPYYNNGLYFIIDATYDTVPENKRYSGFSNIGYVLDKDLNIIYTFGRGYTYYKGYYNGYHYISTSAYIPKQGEENWKAETISGLCKTADGINYEEVGYDERRLIMDNCPLYDNSIVDDIRELQVTTTNYYMNNVCYNVLHELQEYLRISRIEMYRAPLVRIIYTIGEEIEVSAYYDRKYVNSISNYYLSLDGIYGVKMPDDIGPYRFELNGNYYFERDDKTYYCIAKSHLTDKIKVIYNNNILAFETPPEIENARTLIPMRFLFEQMGATVDWDDTTKTATVKKGEDVISFSIDNIEATVNNSIKTMDVPARLINGKTLVPLRFLSEELGYNVEWDGDNRIVTISE